MWDKQPKLRFSQLEFKILHSIIYTLEKKSRKPLRDVLEQNDKVMIRELMIVFGLSSLYFLCMCCLM